MPFVSAKDGTSLYYLDWGSGRPVVFVSSAWLNSQMWEHQLPELVDSGLRCIAYDRRGHGRSDWPWDGYDADTLADDLAVLLDHLDLREVTLVGHSVGGAEVVRYLSRHGTARVSRVALLCATAPFPLQAPDNPDGVPAEAVAAQNAHRMADRPRWNAEMAPSFFALDAAGNEVSSEQIDWMLNLVMQCSPRANVAVFQTGVGTDLRAELRALPVPALVVHGDRDAQAPIELCGRRTAALVPDRTYLEYADAGHGLFVTHAARLNADLIAFAGGAAPG